MQELQSDDFFIPAFLLKLLPQPEANRREAQTEDFLKGVQGWTEYFPVDECVE
jgi:hypothetical protein